MLKKYECNFHNQISLRKEIKHITRKPIQYILQQANVGMEIYILGL